LALALILAFYGAVALLPGDHFKGIKDDMLSETSAFCTKEHFPFSNFTGYVPSDVPAFLRVMAFIDLFCAFYLFFGKYYMKTYITVFYAVNSVFFVMFMLKTNMPAEKSLPCFVFSFLLFLRLVLVRNEIKDHLHID